MTGRKLSSRADVGLGAADGAARRDAGDGARIEPSFSGLADAALGNVIPFGRLRRAEADSGPAIPAPDPRDAPAPPASGRARLAALLAISLALHVGLLLLLERAPPPLESVGLESISVELVLGADSPAGPAQEANAAEQAEAAPPEGETDPVQPDAAAEAVAEAAEPQQPVVAEPQAAPETVVAALPPDAAAPPPEPARPATAPPEPAQAVVPQPADAPARPLDEAAPPDPLPQPSEQARTEPQPAEQPAETAVPATPAPAAEGPPATTARPVVQPPRSVPTPAKPPEKRAAVDTKRPAEPDVRRKPTAAPAGRPQSRGSDQLAARRQSAPSGGVGQGSSAAADDYGSVVRARIVGHVQNLANGLGSGEVVRLSIRLNIDGSGRASGVSVSGSSGRGSLDQAAVAAARGASPFPAPPDGRSRSFTVPLVLRTR